MVLVMGLLIGRRSITFQESFNKNLVVGNGESWQWDCMMNVYEKVEDLKNYASKTCILEPWNPPTPWRHVSYLTMSDFDPYMHKLKEFQRWPHSLLNVRRRWIMALVMACWRTFRNISIEFRQRLCWWEWRMMTMRLHDERWCKHGRSQIFFEHVKHPWSLKPSHTMRACVLSNHVKFWRIYVQVEVISMLAPFTA